MICLGNLGFRLHERMIGTHIFEPGQGPEGRLPFSFEGLWGPPRLGPWLNPKSPDFLTQPFEGTVTAGGIGERVPMRGELALRYVSSASIRYAFTFSHDSRTYRYVGEKVNIRPWNLPVSHTTCFGTLTCDGILVSRSVTHFRLASLPRFLFSFRLTCAP